MIDWCEDFWLMDNAYVFNIFKYLVRGGRRPRTPGSKTRLRPRSTSTGTSEALAALVYRRCRPFRINPARFKIITMFELSESQRRAFDLMKSGRNVFLTGEAGSGKTTVVREFLKQAHDAVVVAPTGIAAINSGG